MVFWAHSNPNIDTSFFRLEVAADRIANTPSTSQLMHKEFSFSSKNSTPERKKNGLKDRDIWTWNRWRTFDLDLHNETGRYKLKDFLKVDVDKECFTCFLQRDKRKYWSAKKFWGWFGVQIQIRSASRFFATCSSGSWLSWQPSPGRSNVLNVQQVLAMADHVIIILQIKSQNSTKD